MSSEKTAAAVYRDFEKLYRLVGFYDGKMSQLVPHIRMIEKNLRQNLEGAPDTGFSFDLLMTRVVWEGSEVFRADTPEQTFVYRLFCEGVKSVVLMQGVNAEELVQWFLAIRKELADPNGDLASLFWKHSSPHIKVALYNALLNSGRLARGSDEIEQVEDLDLALEQTEFISIDEMATRAQPVEDEDGTGLIESPETRLQEAGIRDINWDAPQGEYFAKSKFAEGLNAERVQKLREELADISVTSRAKGLVRFNSEELESLREELESFDEMHVFFNLLMREFEILGSSDKSAKAKELAGESIAAIANTVIKKFHGGLLLLIMDRLEKLKGAGEEDQHQALQERLQASFSDPQNRDTLVIALGKEARVPVAKKLLKHMTPVQWSQIADMMASGDDSAAAINFLTGLVESGAALDRILLGWGKSRLEYLLPFVGQVEWPEKETFVKKCLSSKFPKIVELASQSIPYLSLTVSEARQIFLRMPPKVQRTWARVFFRNPTQEKWKPFMKKMIEEGFWIQGERHVMIDWVMVLLKYFGERALQDLMPLVESRKLFLWAKYPKEREAILMAGLSMPNREMKLAFSELASREKALIFQDKSLKERLKARGES